MKIKKFSVITCSAFCLVLFGCNKQENKTPIPIPQITSILEETPSSVVKDFFGLANEGKYTESEKLLSTEFSGVVKGVIGQMGGGVKGLCDKATRNGTLNKIEIESEQVRGEGATVIAKLYFKDDSTKDDKTSLRKENGKWKITL